MPVIREFAISLLRGLPNNDILGQTYRLVDFVRDNVTYVRDPVNAEYVVSPINMLNSWVMHGYMAGDCDDHTMLLNSLLTSIGIQTKFVGVKFGPTAIFNHVISGVFLGGKIYLVDPCAKGGTEPEYKETLIV